MPSESSAPPSGLGPRGVALWAALGQSVATASGQLALEACRAADRLDDIDAVVRGKGVLELLTFRLGLDFTEDSERHVTVKVEFSGVLSEARQQQANLKALLESLGVKGGAESKPAVPAPAGNPLDELARKRSGAK